MARNLLTDKHLKSLGAKLTTTPEIILNDGDGLQVRARAGKRGFSIVFRYRFSLNGKTGYHALGEYDVLTLAQAREKCNAARRLVADGIDPNTYQEEQKTARATQRQVELLDPTVKGLFELWQRRFLQANRRDAGTEVERRFELDVFPVIGAIKAKAVGKRQIAEILDTILERGARRTANMTMAELRQMFRWALARDIVQVDPTFGLNKKLVGGEEKPRERDLSFDEIRALMVKLPFTGLAVDIQAALLFLLATGARIGEMIQARWQDIDKTARTWFIPAENVKTREEHLVHLSDFALAQLAIMEQYKASPYLLSGRKKDAPFDSKTVTKQVRDRVHVETDAARALKKRTVRGAGTLLLVGGPWTPHDLRRTMASRMGDLGILPHVIEACLNHKPPSKIVRTYQRAEYLPEREHAFKVWGDRLNLIARADQNVVTLDTKRKRRIAKAA